MHKTPNKHKHRSHHKSEFDLYHDVEKIKAALADASYDLKGRAGEIFSQSIDDLKDRSSDIQHGFEDYVAENPFKTVGITLLAGLVIGYLLRK